MKVVAFLPAKGTSQRIKSKNTRLLDGKPLFLHTLEKLCECDFIDEVYLDSESDEILEYANYLRYKPLKRDPALADNKTDGHKMFYNEVRQVEADIYIQILCTSPFIKKSTIKHGIDFLTENEEFDSAILVKRDKQYTWSGNNPNYDRFHIPNSVDLPDTIIETMGLYIVKKDAAHLTKQRFGNKPYMIYAEPIEALDINNPDDFELAENVAKGLNSKEVIWLNHIKHHFNSAIFSDIMDDMGVNSCITGLFPNIGKTKIFGRANTLKIRKLDEGEDYRGIYDGLKTYEKVRSGEVVIVDNEIGDFAYFGELNANLAIRSGAVGTIVNGVTRDINEVLELGYPVFSKGYSCSDVRRRGTVESHNKPIVINDVRVCPGDLIFGDINGIAVIPRDIEEIVMQRAFEKIRKEKKILEKIGDSICAEEIYETEGEF